MLENEFRLRDGLIYLNHAGVSPWPERTVRAVERFAEENMLLGSFHYPKWVQAEAVLRTQLQTLLNSQSKDEIALVKNTSEALSVVAYGLHWEDGDNIVSSDQEFPSNRIVWESLAQRGVEFREATLSGPDSPEDALFSLVDHRTRLITISSVQYGTGLKMDLVRIGEFCKKRGILFCVDAIQSLGALRLDVQEAQTDFVMADGHKWMFGPEGVAAFYCHPEARDRLRLNQYGWHMVEDVGDFDRKEWRPARTARRFECGSPNTMGIHALSASLSLIHEVGMRRIEERVLENSRYLLEELRLIPGLKLITPTERGRHAGIVTFALDDADPVPLYAHLSQHHDVVCALRSGGIRFSPHFHTPLEQLAKVVHCVKDFMAQ